MAPQRVKRSGMRAMIRDMWCYKGFWKSLYRFLMIGLVVNTAFTYFWCIYRENSQLSREQLNQVSLDLESHSDVLLRVEEELNHQNSSRADCYAPMFQNSDGGCSCFLKGAVLFIVGFIMSSLIVCASILFKWCCFNAPNLQDSASHTRSVKRIYPYDVTITRQENGTFGFNITSYDNQTKVFIGRIIEGSPADRCGQLHVGDRILAVNNMNILNHAETVNLIKFSGYSITLTIYQPKQDDASSTTTNSRRWYKQLDDRYHVIELRQGTRGFGFSIKGDKALFVSEIQKFGLADLDGKLKVGDQIIKINGKNTKNMTCAQATELTGQGKKYTVRLLVKPGRRRILPQDEKLPIECQPQQLLEQKCPSLPEYKAVSSSPGLTEAQAEPWSQSRPADEMGNNTSGPHSPLSFLPPSPGFLSPPPLYPSYPFVPGPFNNLTSAPPARNDPLLPDIHGPLLERRANEIQADLETMDANALGFSPFAEESCQWNSSYAPPSRCWSYSAAPKSPSSIADEMRLQQFELEEICINGQGFKI